MIFPTYIAPVYYPTGNRIYYDLDHIREIHTYINEDMPGYTPIALPAHMPKNLKETPKELKDHIKFETVPLKDKYYFEAPQFTSP